MLTNVVHPDSVWCTTSGRHRRGAPFHDVWLRLKRRCSSAASDRPGKLKCTASTAYLSEIASSSGESEHHKAAYRVSSHGFSTVGAPTSLMV